MSPLCGWYRRLGSVLGHWAAACLLTALGLGPALAQPSPLQEAGRRIYLQGLLGDGQTLRASGAGGTALSGPAAACVQCHRRSGMGSREGSLAIPAVAGPLLFKPAVSLRPRRPGAAAQEVTGSRQDTRAAYDDATLARALRQGLDSSGRPLDALMPRYDLGEAELQALSAYLHALQSAPVPGWQDGVLHLATILTPDADPVRATTVRQALQAWAASAPLGDIPVALQVWQLQGPAETWQRQLQEQQRQQAVYAVLSGAGRAEWTPVRDFCEQAALPCLFPLVDWAPGASTDFYSVYLSRGVPIEAQMLARHLGERQPQPGRVVQVYSDAAGRAAAGLLEQGLEGTAHVLRAWQAARPAEALADVQPQDAVVLWLRPTELQQLVLALPAGPASEPVYVSAQLAPPEALELPLPWRQKTRWVSAHSDPQRLYGKSVLGLVPWAARLNLALEREPRALLAEVYAATYFFTDALARMRGPWSQDYLLETLESANFGRPAGAAYYTLSLAAGQREAAKGGHLLGHATPQDPAVVPLGPRITP